MTQVWEWKSRKPLATLKGLRETVSLVAISPDGTKIIAGSEHGAAQVWDASSGKPLAALRNVGSAMAFSPDGSRVVTGCLNPLGAPPGQDDEKRLVLRPGI